MHAPASEPTSSRRGTPPLLRPSPRTTRRGQNARAAWALRANRLLGPDSRMAVGRNFAAALRADGWTGPISSAQLSRWETGQSALDYPLVRRYEQLLGLPSHHLVAVIDLIYREAGRPGPAGRLPLPRSAGEPESEVVDRAEALLERALSSDPMTGVDWNLLTADLYLLPSLVLHPRRCWDDLAHRLLTELACTDGLPWVHRNEATNRLLLHPRAARPMLAACAELAADPAHQTTIEPLCLLGRVPSEDATKLVLDQLHAPASDQALGGALLAAVGTVRQRELPPAGLNALTSQIAAISQPGTVSDLVWRLVPAVLQGLPLGYATPAVAHLRRVVERDPRARTAQSNERTVDPLIAVSIAGRLASDAVSRMDTGRLPDDQMFPLLVEEALFCADPTGRLQATLLLAATPYAAPLAQAAAAELSRVWVTGPVAQTGALLWMLAALRQPADPAPVERIVLAAGVRPELQAAAVRAAGRLPSGRNEAFWRAGAARHQPIGPVGAGQLEVLRRLVYALGSNGHHRLLAELIAAPDIPAEVRSAASWWTT
jgi:hypothetical protein